MQVSDFFLKKRSTGGNRGTPLGTFLNPGISFLNLESLEFSCISIRSKNLEGDLSKLSITFKQNSQICSWQLCQIEASRWCKRWESPHINAPCWATVPRRVSLNSCWSQMGIKWQRVKWAKPLILFSYVLLMWKCHPVLIKAAPPAASTLIYLAFLSSLSVEEADRLWNPWKIKTDLKEVLSAGGWAKFQR